MPKWLSFLTRFFSPAEAQRAHIALLDAQIRELHSLVEIQARTIAELRAENGDPKSQNRPPQKEIKTLAHNKRLEELKEKILVLLAHNDRLYDAKIAGLSGVTKQLATLHLHELREFGFASSQWGVDDNSYTADVWAIEQLGRKYLASNGFL